MPSDFGLRLHLRQQDARNKRTASDIVRIAETLRDSLKPSDLVDVQHELRGALVSVGSRTLDWESRRLLRKDRLTRILRGREDAGRVLGRALFGGAMYSDLLRVERNILRQGGDALAWIVFGGDPHQLAPLFDETKAHVPVTLGAGLAGVATISQALNESGKLYALENDLTRCLGAGDITARLAVPRFVEPLLIEVKSRGALQPGGSLEIGLTTPLSDSADAKETWDTLRSVLDRSAEGPSRTTEPTRKSDSRFDHQKVRLIEQARVLGVTVRRPYRRLDSPSKTLWEPLNAVLSRAMTTGRAIEPVEKGVVMIGVRMAEGADVREVVADVFREATEMGIQMPDARAYSSLDLFRRAMLAPIVCPLPLWRIEKPLREALLSLDLLYLCLYEREIWPRAFSEFDIAVTESRAGWVMERGESQGAAGRIEVAKLRYGIAFSGISPAESARQLSERL